MKIKIASILAVLFVLFSLASCEEEKEVVIDAEKLSGEISALYENGEIELVNIDNAEAFDIQYGLKGLYSFFYAEGSIAITSDEIVILEGTDADNAKKAYDTLEAYRKSRIKLFRSYAPEQVPKLEEALLERAGRYIIFVVAEDTSEAEKIWREYTK